MRFLPLERFALLVVCAISLSACGGGGGASSPAPYVSPWAADVDATNDTAVCAAVGYFEKINGSAWYGPINLDEGPHVKPGQTGTSERTFRSSQPNAQFRVQAGFYKSKSCSGPQTIVQADSQTIEGSAGNANLTAVLSGTAGNYAIAILSIDVGAARVR
jgi:hypothetical protein